MKLHEMKIYNTAFKGRVVWNAGNSEVLGYYLGRHEAYIISKGKRGKVYVLCAQHMFENEVSHKQPGDCFSGFNFQFIHGNDMMEVAEYIYKATKKYKNKAWLSKELLEPLVEKEI